MEASGSAGLRHGGPALENGNVDGAGQERRRPVILCFVAYYLPGYRSGGPVRTIANFVDHLGDEFDIRIVTRDRDALDTEPYPDVAVDAWNTVGKAQVFYASSRTTTLRGVARLLSETPHDLLYVNSFFALGFTTLPLLAHRLRMAPRNPCVIAPRGEFSVGAIALKAWKKRPYLWIAKRFGLYQGLRWQASSEFEVADIEREFGAARGKITVAPNLAPSVPAAEAESGHREPGPLRIVFLSRISPMKNLDYLLRALVRVRTPIQLTMVGPLREPDYWEQCRAIMAELPPTVTAEHVGEVTPAEVLNTFARYDLFALPTRGENYGHVILEALMAGTPVLISDQTPWRGSDDGAVETLPLADVDGWVAAIERWASFDAAELQLRREAAFRYARNYLESSGAVEQNRRLFLGALRDAIR
jgi:glycosyltransferase involved in cell wall biosynthesis